MASHRLKRAGLQRPGLQRTVRGAAAAVAVAAFVTLVSPPAPVIADPELPDNVSVAVQQLAELNREAEVLTERWHFARDQLAERRAELDQARADAAAAAAAGNQARAIQGEYREKVDRLTNASFKGARLNRLSALLVSSSREDFLDQMSALDILATENKEVLDRLMGAVLQAEQAEQAARDAEARAQAAEQDAARIEAELTRTRAEMDQKIELVEQRLAELSVTERASFVSVGQTNVPLPVAGTGIGTAAVRAALSRQGAPYRWGGEGPNAFDCSGLVKWSFAQAGLPGLPHSSRVQAQLGRAVSRNDLKPGDLVALYSPVSHIGIYVGDGRYVHAPQAGDVVKVVPIPWHQVTALRRIA